MKLFIAIFLITAPVFSVAQRGLVTLGSSTTAGLAATPIDSSWVNRVDRYYRVQLGVLNATYNLGVSGATSYIAMPTGSVPPAGRPSPDPAHNVTQAKSLLSLLSVPSNGVIIVNFPTNGYDNYTIAEILSTLQSIYNNAVQSGNRCYVTTTQPRSDGNFALPAIKKKLAILKDSIINRFGVDNTINFWDGMYNPADTTILPAYSAGDNVHFNNLGHRILFQRVRAKNIFQLSPALGDYRSNMANGATGTWSTASTWQVYNGTSWIAATVPPTSAHGVVTIQNGHRVDMTSAVTFDQTVVAAGGQLFIYNFLTPTVFTLNNGDGNDITVNGSLFVSVNCTLTGAGRIVNNSAGTLTLRNQGILSTVTTNNGTMVVSGTGNLQNTTLTNNNAFTLQDFTMNLNNATFINNGTITLPYILDNYFATTTGTGTLTNTASGIINKTSSLGISWTSATVTFNNAGSIRGGGQYNFLTTGTNTGTVSPGNSSAGTLTVNPSFVTSKAPVFNIEINSTGALAGINYDRVTFSTVNFVNTNVSGSTLNVTDNAGDPVGTTYTIFNTTLGGTITGPFTRVNLSPTLGNLTYGTNTITVQKTSIGKHWVGTYLYQNNFSSAADLAAWNLVENNGTGSWTLSANNSAILKMDDAAGSYAVRLFHETGGVPSRYALDKVNGVVEFRVVALTGGNQRFFLQAQEFQSNGTYIKQQTILTPRNTAGFFTINLSDFTWDPLTTQIRFIIGGENFSSQQGTIEFDYFKYTNTSQNWSNSANWSASAGGTGGAGIPQAAEAVFFDAVRPANCNLDASITVANITMGTGYTGMVTQGANAVTISNTANFAGGDFSGGSGNITIGGTYTLNGSNFISTSARLELRGNVALTSGSFTHNSGSVRFNAINSTTPLISGSGRIFYDAEFVGLGRTYNITATGNLTVQNSLSLSGSLFLTLNTGTIDVKGDININNTATGGGGNATIIASGTGTQNLTGATVSGQGVLPKFSVAKTSGTLVMRNFISLANDWSYTSGTVDATTHTSSVLFTGPAAVSSGTMAFHHFVVSSGTVTLASTLNVNGNLTITSGSLAGAANTISLKGVWTNNGSFTSTSGGTVNFNGINSITGSSSTQFQNVTVSGELQSPSLLLIAGNFQNQGDFISSAGTVRFNGSTPQSITGTTTTFNNIDVTNSSSVVSVNSNQNLRGILTLGTNATFDADGSSGTAIFTLLSSSDNPVQDGAIGILPSGANVTGNVTVKRYMTLEGRSDNNIYRYISSPVQQGTVADIQTEIPVTGTFTGASACTGCVTTSQSMFAYNEAVTTDTNVSGTSDLNDGYIDFPANSNSEILQPGRGYAMYVRGNILSSSLWDIRGVINQANASPITFPVSFTSSSNIANDGWNLVGNPFPSTINWNAAGWTKTNVDGSVYVTDNSGMSTRYAAWNGTVGTNGGTGYIATGQGFWIKASSTPTLRAAETVKAPGQSTQFFRTKSIDNLVRIGLSGNSDQTDETIIHFRDDATAGFDTHADAWKLLNSAYNVSTTLQGGEMLAINSQGPLNTNVSLNLVVDNIEPGSYKLTFKGIDSFGEDVTIMLADNFIGTMTELTDPIVSFTVTTDPGSKGPERFVLHFGVHEQEVVTGVYMEPAIEVYPVPVSDELHIQTTAGFDSATLTTITGVLVAETDLKVEGILRRGQIDVSSLAPGFYLVRLTGGNRTFITKVIKR